MADNREEETFFFFFNKLRILWCIICCLPYFDRTPIDLSCTEKNQNPIFIALGNKKKPHNGTHLQLYNGRRHFRTFITDINC